MRWPTNARRLGLECALMFILMLLLSPMSHKTHFGILMLPGFAWRGCGSISGIGLRGRQ